MNPTSIATLNIESLRAHDVNPGDLDGTNNKNDPEQDNLFTGEKLKETLQPLYISLRCFGIMYDGVFPSHNRRSNLVEPESESTDKTRTQRDAPRRHSEQKEKYSIGKCYCIFIAVLLCIQVIIYSKNMFTAETFLDVMQVSGLFGWMLLCACQQLVLIHANFTQSKEKMSKFGKFIKEFVLVKGHNITDTKRQIKVIVLVTWVIVLVSTATVYVALFQSDKVSGVIEVRKIILGKWSIEIMDIITYIYLPIIAFFIGVWLFSTANYVSLCVLVAKRFDDVFQRASFAISLKKNINFASLRREHVQLCRVVSALDDILSPSALVSYAIYIPTVCILLEACILKYDNSSLIQKLAYVFCIIVDVTILAISSVSGALVTHKVYRLSEVIYDINANNLDRTSKFELMLLISNLNSNSTGLTVGGLTTITKGMILTVFGTVIGYFTILIQFKS